MSKSKWGPIVWNMIHCLTLKIKPNFFEQEKGNILMMLNNICTNLPCPICSVHASQYIRKNKMHLVKTKQELVAFIFNMHNDVNKRLKRKLASKDVLKTYEQIKFADVCNDFFRIIFMGVRNNRMIMHSMHKEIASNKIYKILKGTLYKYVN